jgi:hypothetical protein
VSVERKRFFNFSAFGFFRWFGIAYFVGMFLYLILVLFKQGFAEEAKALLAPLAILTSALIAGFAVEKSINTTRQFREEDKEKNIRKSKKIIKETLRYLLNEAKMQRESIPGFVEMVKVNFGNAFFYSQEILNEKLLVALNTLVVVDVIGVLDEEAIAKIYEIRFETLTLIHQYDILKKFVAVNNDTLIQEQTKYIEKELDKIIVKFEAEIEND